MQHQILMCAKDQNPCKTNRTYYTCILTYTCKYMSIYIWNSKEAWDVHEGVRSTWEQSRSPARGRSSPDGSRGRLRRHSWAGCRSHPRLRWVRRASTAGGRSRSPSRVHQETSPPVCLFKKSKLAKMESWRMRIQIKIHQTSAKLLLFYMPNMPYPVIIVQRVRQVRSRCSVRIEHTLFKMSSIWMVKDGKQFKHKLFGTQ